MDSNDLPENKQKQEKFISTKDFLKRLNGNPTQKPQIKHVDAGDTPHTPDRYRRKYEEESEYKGIWKGVLSFVFIMWLIAGAPTSCSEDEVYKSPNQEKYDSWAWKSGKDKAWGDCERSLPYGYSLQSIPSKPSEWTNQEWAWWKQGYRFGYEDAAEITLQCYYPY